MCIRDRRHGVESSPPPWAHGDCYLGETIVTEVPSLPDETSHLADRLGRLYSGVVFDVMRSLGLDAGVRCV